MVYNFNMIYLKINRSVIVFFFFWVRCDGLDFEGICWLGVEFIIINNSVIGVVLYMVICKGECFFFYFYGDVDVCVFIYLYSCCFVVFIEN